MEKFITLMFDRPAGRAGGAAYFARGLRRFNQRIRPSPFKFQPRLAL